MALMLRRLFQETSPLRRGILAQGMRTLFPNAKFAAATGPATFSANDIRSIYSRIDPSKADDVDRILKGLPPGSAYTLDQLKALNPGKWGSARTEAAWAKALEEMGQTATAGTPTDPGYDIEGSPLFSTSATAAERQALESQYGQAGRQVVQNAGGRGGQLLKAQMLMGQDRARAMTDLTSNAEQRGINQALATLTGATLPDANAVIGGQGNLASTGAANTQAWLTRDAYARQQAAERQTSLGRSMGSLAADYAKKANANKSSMPYTGGAGSFTSGWPANFGVLR